MLNSVGLQNPGVRAWRDRELEDLLATGARVVASIWGHSVDEYGEAAAMLAGLSGQVVAVEVNLSCPNLGVAGGTRLAQVFSHSASATADAITAAAGSGLPRWAKLSPVAPDLVAVAGAALDAGAEALTLVNTVPGLAIDPETRRPRLGAGSGGLSGPAIRPLAVRAIHECRLAFPEAAIVGVGGVSRGEHAVELLIAGANAVQVGTATFADPRAAARVVRELERWCRRRHLIRSADLVGTVHA